MLPSRQEGRGVPSLCQEGCTYCLTDPRFMNKRWQHNHEANLKELAWCLSSAIMLCKAPMPCTRPSCAR